MVNKMTNMTRGGGLKVPCVCKSETEVVCDNEAGPVDVKCQSIRERHTAYSQRCKTTLKCFLAAPYGSSLQMKHRALI